MYTSFYHLISTDVYRYIHSSHIYLQSERMGRIPVRFERVAAAFEADVARVRPCESGGGGGGETEHSPEDLSDLSDLVKSFMEKKEEEEDAIGFVWDDGDEDLEWFDSEKREILQTIFSNDGGDDDDAKRLIRREIELVMNLVAENEKSAPEFKRQLMSRMRERGLDAGELCCNFRFSFLFSEIDF